MVLKLLFIFAILFQNQAYAKNSRKGRAFISAKNSYNKMLYRKSLKTLSRSFNFESNKTPIKVLSLAAKNFEKIKDPLKAYKIYSFIIWLKYKDINEETTSSYIENSNTDDLPDDIPNKLQEIYFRQLIIFSNFYKKRYQENDLNKLKQLKNKISMYADILIEIEYKEDKVEKILNRIERFETKLTDNKYHSYYSLRLGLVTWKDIIQLTKTSTEDITEIRSTAEGLSLCGGLKKENAFFIFKASLCYASASADVGRKTEDIDYFQENVLITMYSIMPQVLWKPYNGDTAIGISVPLIYRSGDYTEVKGYTLENTEITTYGYLITFLWMIDPISIELQFGKIKKFSSSFWDLGIIYNF